MKKGTAITFALGVFAGLTLCGPAAQAATNLTATLSNQPIYVDGRCVSMTAFAIGGNNYVKLRDVGEAVGFNVYWDGSAVQIESDRPYIGTSPTVSSSVTPLVQQTITVPTEESVQAALRALREQYPNNTAWPSPYRSTSGGPYGISISNCAGWAILCSDAAFGNLPWRQVNNPTWDQIRSGDLVEYSNPQGRHVVVVVSKTDDAMVITDSGTTQKATGAENISATGWRNSPVSSSIRGTPVKIESVTSGPDCAMRPGPHYCKRMFSFKLRSTGSVRPV